jgi:Transposase and inactivated derivatives
MLTDAMWRRLLRLLPPQKPKTGRPSLDPRRFLEAVLWLARTGAPWRDLPEDVMNWRTAWRRLQRWTAARIWGRIVAELRAMAPDADWDVHLLDSSVIRAHSHAARARRASGEQALGLSRGGFSTKLHLRADAEGRPVALHLTGGERHDLLGVGPLFEQGALRTGKPGQPRWKPSALIADKAYSAAWLLEALRRKRIVPIIPSRADQPGTSDFDRTAYRGRNLVERLVGKLMQVRRVATRCCGFTV